MTSTNLGPAIASTANQSAQLASPATASLQQSYTYATLPSGSVVGQQAYTTDQGQQTWNGVAWLPSVASAPNTAVAQQRLNLINAFNAGSLIAAPNWAATTAYALYAVVTLPNGQLIQCATAGTSGSTVPSFSTSSTDTAYVARSITDGTVTWYGTPLVNAINPPPQNIPTVYTGATAAAVGLTEVNFASGGSGVVPSTVKAFGGNVINNAYQNSIGGYVCVVGVPPLSGTGTTEAVAAGYPSAFTYQAGCTTIEWYQTDSVVGITFANVTSPIIVEVDGQLVSANPITTAGGSHNCVKLDYNGVVKRRLVRFSLNSNGTVGVMFGAAVTTIGFCETTDTINDTLLCLGDSITGTLSGAGCLYPAVNFAASVQRYLGFAGCAQSNIAGSGYVSVNANSLTTGGIVANYVNQILFKQYAPSHILICSGYNDWGLVIASGTTIPAVTAAALACWQAVRAIFPNTKITINDGFPESNSANATYQAGAAALLAAFNAWGDTNSRFVQSTGPSASQAWTQGSGNTGSAIQAGTACLYVGPDGTHPSPMGCDNLGKRMARAITLAWNGAY